MARKDDAASERYMHARKMSKGTKGIVAEQHDGKMTIRNSNAKAVGSKGSAAMKGQGAFIDGKPAPDMHKGKKGKKFLDPALQAEYEAGMLDGVDMDKGMKSRRHGVSALGKGQGAFIDGAKAKLTKKTPPPPKGVISTVGGAPKGWWSPGGGGVMPGDDSKPRPRPPVPPRVTGQINKPAPVGQMPKPRPTTKPAPVGQMPKRPNDKFIGRGTGTSVSKPLGKGMRHKNNELDKELVMFNTRKGMTKGNTCPNCGSKMTKGMCKCGY